MVDSVHDSPLGRQTEYIAEYSPSLLFPIARKLSREALRLASPLPFSGVDVWTGYEVSWLNSMGMPQVAVVEFYIPCESEFIVESKSFKLYLNSFNQTRYADFQQVKKVLIQDLSTLAGADIEVNIYSLHEFAGREIASVDGASIDHLPIAIEHYHPEPGLLAVSDAYVEETLCSDLLKTNCPVTGQPDWASVQISYTGKKIVPESLLRYIVSFRQHQDFHEHCVERMFTDIFSRCSPDSLSVYARYTRRGGLDINPFRTSEKNKRPPITRLVRQ